MMEEYLVVHEQLGSVTAIVLNREDTIKQLEAWGVEFEGFNEVGFWYMYNTPVLDGHVVVVRIQ